MRWIGLYVCVCCGGGGWGSRFKLKFARAEVEVQERGRRKRQDGRTDGGGETRGEVGGVGCTAIKIK